MRTFILIMLLSLSVFAAPVEWSLSFTPASAKAKSKNKLLLVYITQPGCGTCKFMEENVFPDKKVHAYLTANYVGVKLYLGDAGLPQHLKPFASPTFYILDDEQREVTDAVIGGKDADGFLEFLEEGVDYNKINMRNKEQK